MTLLTLCIVVTLTGSFLCSLLESVLLSIPATYIAMGVQNKKPSAARLLHHKENLESSLAAILIFNTVCNTAGSFGVGMQALNLYGSKTAAIGSGILTLLILIFGEIIPKTLGAGRWKTFAGFTSYAISGLVILLYPFVKLSELLSDLLGGASPHKVTKEEMIVTAEIGASDGTLNKKESTIIRNLLMLDNIYANDIMTPRSVLMAFDWEQTVEEVMKEQPIRYSRIPVFEKDLDNVKGFVHRYRIMEAYSEDKDEMHLKDIMQEIHMVPETISVSAVLDQLIARGDHIFVAVDEYGSTTGLVTLEDAIETLLGVEIVDEFDSVVDLREYALEQWKKRKQSRQTPSKL